MDVTEAIRSRVSVREYEPRAIPREQIERLLGVALVAPNHRMTEPVEFRVMGPAAKRAYGEALAERKARKVEDEEAARLVREKVIRERLDVPAMVAVLVAEDDNPEIREEDYATAFMVVENLCLTAVAMGLGTHIKTGAVLGDAPLREALRTRHGQRVVAIVYLGVPATGPSPKARRPADEVTEWLD